MVDLPSILSDRACLDTVLCDAREAGSAIPDVYHGDLEVTHKGDRSPLTRADRRSHEILAGPLAGVQVAQDGNGRTALPLPVTPRDDASRERDGITVVGSRSHPSLGLQECRDRMQGGTDVSISCRLAAR